MTELRTYGRGDGLVVLHVPAEHFTMETADRTGTGEKPVYIRFNFRSMSYPGHTAIGDSEDYRSIHWHVSGLRSALEGKLRCLLILL